MVEGLSQAPAYTSRAMTKIGLHICSLKLSLLSEDSSPSGTPCGPSTSSKTTLASVFSMLEAHECLGLLFWLQTVI